MHLGRFLVCVGVLLWMPSATACSFIAEPDGGATVRIHDIRTGQFGFSGPTEFAFNMGNGDGWTSDVRSGGDHPAFTYDYGVAGTYVVQVQCHYLDDDTWEEAIPTQVTVGGLFGGLGFEGLPWYVWAIIGVGAVGTIAAGRRSAMLRAQREAARQMVPSRTQVLQTGRSNRRALGCFPTTTQRPKPFSSGVGLTYEATAPAGTPLRIDRLHAQWTGRMLHLDWELPHLSEGMALTGYRLYEQRQVFDESSWHLRENLPPDITGINIDHDLVDRGPYKVLAYELRPVFEAGGDPPTDGIGATFTL